MNNDIKRIEKDTIGEIAVPADKYWELAQSVVDLILKLVQS